MVKGRVNRLAYSGRSPLDYRNPGKTFLGGDSIYRPSLMEAIACMPGFNDVEAAKQRVSIDSSGKYKYTPSVDYELAKLRLRFKFKK